MQADFAEMSWDSGKGQWLLRMGIGDEVIRRHCKNAQDANESDLRAVAEKTVVDEGYELAVASWSDYKVQGYGGLKSVCWPGLLQSARIMDLGVHIPWSGVRAGSVFV